MNPWGVDVVESMNLRQGQVYLVQDPSRSPRSAPILVIGIRPPTEIQKIVMDGVASALPWFRDPYAVDVKSALEEMT